MNRLKSVADTGWSRSFGYDAFGNINVTANSSSIPPNIDMPDPTIAYNSKNQRTDQSYDLAGNLNSVQQGRISLTYDAENRQLTAGPSSYSYDGNGRRVIKNSGGNTTVYVYDVMGQLTAEYNTVAPSSAPCVTCYLSYDHLGSVRLVTNATGGIVSRHDYLPFGEEILAGQAGRSTDLHFGGTDNVTQHFTGKELDQESGLDYFGARYYGSAIGRFTSPDWSTIPTAVPYANLHNPQSLNLYSYVTNNPLSRTDQDGHNWWDKLKNVFGDAGCWCEGSRATISAANNRYEAWKSRMDDVRFWYSVSPAGRALILSMVVSYSEIGPVAMQGTSQASVEMGAAAEASFPELIGFSEGQGAMLQNAVKALQEAGYDTTPLKNLIYSSDMPSSLAAMSLPDGAALGAEAFSSQKMLTHTLEEELIHIQQTGQGLRTQYGPGTAQSLEEAADAQRKFQAPK